MNTKKDIRFGRERYDKGLRFYKTKGINPQPSQLRVVVPFVANKGTYVFDLKKDQSLAHAIEKLLKRNDLFVARAIGLGILVDITATPGIAPIYTYPVLAGDHLPAGLKGLTNLNAMAMYNGTLSMKTGQVINFSAFPTNRFLNIPETQPVVIVNAAGDGYESAGIMPQFNLENLLEELPEEIVFAGTKDQPVTLEFPACTIAGEAGTTAYAVLMVDGWLYEGGTTEDCHSKENPYDQSF